MSFSLLRIVVPFLIIQDLVFDGKRLGYYFTQTQVILVFLVIVFSLLLHHQLLLRSCKGLSFLNPLHLVLIVVVVVRLANRGCQLWLFIRSLVRSLTHFHVVADTMSAKRHPVTFREQFLILIELR